MLCAIPVATELIDLELRKLRYWEDYVELDADTRDLVKGWFKYTITGKQKLITALNGTSKHLEQIVAAHIGLEALSKMDKSTVVPYSDVLIAEDGMVRVAHRFRSKAKAGATPSDVRLFLRPGDTAHTFTQWSEIRQAAVTAIGEQADAAALPWVLLGDIGHETTESDIAAYVEYAQFLARPYGVEVRPGDLVTGGLLDTVAKSVAGHQPGVVPSCAAGSRMVAATTVPPVARRAS